jgi:hypothetical protein
VPRVLYGAVRIYGELIKTFIYPPASFLSRMSKTVTVRIERKLLDGAREKFPELKDVSDTDVVRIVFRKLLEAKP